MNYTQIDITFQEVPNEVSLTISIPGCSLRCEGCHSSFLWNKNSGNKLTEEFFKEKIVQYQSLITCVCFLGGEWEENDLVNLLKIAKKYSLKTCLYTGEYEASENLKKHLTYLKIGPWDIRRGGLDSRFTNQKFINVETQECLNHLFQTNSEGVHTC